MVFPFYVPQSGTYRAEGISYPQDISRRRHIVCRRHQKLYSEYCFFVRALSKSPLPLAGGVGVGSQRLHEGVCTQTKPRAKYNKMRKIRRGGFFPFYQSAICGRRGVKERNPPAHGRIYSFRNVGGAPPFRSTRGISPSAESDLRLCLKNPRGSDGFPWKTAAFSRRDRVADCRRQS